MEMVSIPQERYDELIKDQKLLQALCNAGVDSWEGYELARESLDE